MREGVTVLGLYLKQIGVLLILVLMASPSWSEVYQWKDAQGRIHFGDTPPNKNKAKNITSNTRNINISSDNSTSKMIKHYEQQKEKEQAAKYKAYQKAKQKRPDMKKQCRLARNRLHTIQGRVYFTDKSGKTVNVSERERQKMAHDLDEKIKQYCK